MKKISDGDLKLFEDRIKRAKFQGVDRFYATHGALVMHTKTKEGKREELLFASESLAQREAAYLLSSITSPDKLAELVRGYRLAKRAGML